MADTKSKTKKRAVAETDRANITAGKPATPGVSKWQFRTRAVAVALILGLALGGGGGFATAWYMYRPVKRPVAGPTYVPIDAWNPRKGPEHGKVTIIEFSDFQCPYCGKARATVDEVLEEYPDQVTLVYRHRPLSFHKDARNAAMAMQAANRQGKAWEMHDKMFDNGKDLSSNALETLAAQIGLDVARFKTDMADPKIAEEVAADEKAAETSSTGGTPTFFINGRRLVGAQPKDAFKKVINEELKKAEELLKGGTPPAELYEKIARAQTSN